MDGADFIPDAEFQPDAHPSQGGASADFVPDEQFIPDEPKDNSKYESFGQEAMTGLEGAARGLTFGLSDAAYEPIRHIAQSIGLNPDSIAPSAEEVEARKEANPGIAKIGEISSLVGGTLLGVGAPALIGKIAATAVPIAAETSMGRIGVTALKGAIEAGLFQGGDEVSKAALGQADPETPVATVLTNMGAAGLLGAATGGVFGTAGEGLRKIGETQLGTKSAQLMTDFGNRWNFLQKNPDIAEAAAQEFQDFHGTTKAVADEVYGASGLKDQAIRKLVPPMNESIMGQNEELARQLQSKATEMLGDIDSFPPRFHKMFTTDVNRWMEVATDPNASSYESFNATQELKQRLQSYAKYDKQVAPFAPERAFVDTAKQMASRLRDSLENENVWGDAAKIQKGTNKAFTDFLPSLKDAEKKFTTKVEGETVVDPAKISTFVRQHGKATGEIKRQMMGNFIDAAEKYRSQISELHNQLGLESPIQPSSLNAIKSVLGDSTHGADLADKVYNMTSGPSAGGRHAAGPIFGAIEGYHEGGVKGAAAGAALGYVAPTLAKGLGKQISNRAVPFILRALSTGNTSGLQDVLDHAASVDRGLMKMNRSIEALFKAGGQQYLNEEVSDKDREKLRKYIESGSQTEQMQNSLAPNSQPQSTSKPHFAKGGEVASLIPHTAAQPSQSIVPTNGIETHFPEQNMLLQAAKTRVNGYLNQQHPVESTGLPFDHQSKDKAKERSYNHLLDLANKPLSILSKVKQGTITPQDVQHFQGLYPEIYNQLSKKITDQVTKAQQSGETPPYKLRQALGLFLGGHLDSSMTPQLILAAQQTYQKSPAQQPNQKSPPSSKAPLGKSANRYKTSDQAVLSRQQSDH